MRPSCHTQNFTRSAKLTDIHHTVFCDHIPLFSTFRKCQKGTHSFIFIHKLRVKKLFFNLNIFSINLVYYLTNWYTQQNAECQRIARGDKKAFFNEQSKEIEENNRMGKTRDLFKKIGNIKETFHARMGVIKDRKGKDLTEAEEIKRRQEYTEELYKKGLNDS